MRTWRIGYHPTDRLKGVPKRPTLTNQGIEYHTGAYARLARNPHVAM